jgi:hypothetical protein
MSVNEPPPGTRCCHWKVVRPGSFTATAKDVVNPSHTVEGIGCCVIVIGPV